MDAFSVLSKVFKKDGGFYKSDMLVADVGANLGYHSLWSNEIFKGTLIRIHAFEPSPHILPFLHKNVTANQGSAVTIIEKAVADKEGELSFFIGHHHHSSSLVAEWAREGKSLGEELRVKSIVLDDYFYNGPGSGRGPDFLKMDIEGGGVYALPGCNRIFTQARPLVYIESHTPEEDAEICKTLLTHDYQAYRLQTLEWVADRSTYYPNKQGVWGHMLLVPTEKAARVKKLLS